METVEFTLGGVAWVLLAGGLGLMIWPSRIAARQKAIRPPAADEILHTRILGFAIAAIGAFMLYMIASHHHDGHAPTRSLRGRFPPAASHLP